jgi:two-component system sensor histidine kinase CiaH
MHRSTNIKNYDSYINKIENLINNILKLSKLESSESQIDFNSVDSEKIITTAIKQLDPIIKNRANKINFIASKKKLLIYVNQESIVQLITIILDNANKYSPKNSIIDVSHYIENHQTVIEVKDHGEGMDKETLKHIFDKFYRADNSRNKTTEGYGMGLSIAKMITDINQANNFISSQVHDGATVKIYFKQLKDKLIKTT